jgi:hypothetical protein
MADEIKEGYEGPPKQWSPSLEDDPEHKKRNDAMRALAHSQRELMKADMGIARKRVEHHNAKPFCHRHADKGMLPEVRCRCCNKLIVTIQEGEPLYKRELKGKTFVYVPVMQKYTPDYAEIKLLFDDGSAHVANCCKECAAKALAGIIDLDAFYAHDLAQWLAHADSHELAVQYGKRRPIKALPIGLED